MTEEMCKKCGLYPRHHRPTFPGLEGLCYGCEAEAWRRAVWIDQDTGGKVDARKSMLIQRTIWDKDAELKQE